MAVFLLFISQTRLISSLPHYFLTRWNADVQRARGPWSEEVRKFFQKKIV